MTPPSLAAVAVRPIGATTRPVSARPARRRERTVTEYLSPAHASAVVVPPTVVFLGAVALAVVASRLTVPAVAGWRAAAVTGLLLPLAYVVATLLRGLGYGRFGAWTAVPVAVSLAVGLNAALPGAGMPVAALLLPVALALAAGPVTAAWKRRWQRVQEVEATLVLPSPMEAGLLLARLERVPGLRIASLLIPGEDDGILESVLGRPVHCRIVPGLSASRRAIVSCPNRDPIVEAVVAQLVARGYHVESESSVLRAAEGRIDSDLVSPLNLLLSRRWGGAREWAFRVRDLVLAVPALLVLSPLFALIALAIRLDSRGPAFYRQRRLGSRGRPFHVLKFRTMRQDAEMSGPRWATENDPRVTRMGRWLRRWRIDELPQLWNVAAGQMSLVGPRPERAHFSRKLRGDIPMFELRTALRPGITGWAQVRSSYASGAEEARVKLDHDLFYFTRRSLWFDLAILFETVRVALSGSGSR